MIRFPGAADGAKITSAEVKDGNVIVRMQEANGLSSKAIVEANGKTKRYNSEGKISSLSQERPAVQFGNGQFIHKNLKNSNSENLISLNGDTKEDISVGDNNLQNRMSMLALDESVIHGYMSAAAQHNSVQNSHSKVAIRLKVLEKPNVDDSYKMVFPKEIASGLTGALAKITPKDKEAFLYKDKKDAQWHGLTTKEWNTVKRKLDKTGDGYTVIHPKKDGGFISANYHNGMLDNNANGQKSLTTYDTAGNPTSPTNANTEEPSNQIDNKEERPVALKM